MEIHRTAMHFVVVVSFLSSASETLIYALLGRAGCLPAIDVPPSPEGVKQDGVPGCTAGSIER
jgi:hypothetical protein